MKEKTVQLDKFDGIRSNLDVERLAPSDLAAGVNIELDASGKPRGRLGVTQRIGGIAPKSFWSDGTSGYFKDGTALKRFTPPSSASVLRSGLSASARMVFERHAGIGPVFYTDGEVTGRIQEGVSKPWGIDAPPVPGAILTNGDLRDGWYAFAVTYLRRDGLESGAKALGQVKAGVSSGVSLIGIAVSSDPDVVAKRVYFTGRNGEEPFLVGTIPNAQTTFVYAADTKGSRILDKLGKAAPLPGHLLAYNNGRIFTARGPFLQYTDFGSPEITDPRTNFLPIGQDPTIVAPVAGGIYVATRDRTVFLDGSSPKEFQMKPLATYGAPLGNYVEVDGAMVGKDGIPGACVAWMSTAGWVVGDAAGNLTNLTQRRYLAPGASRAASMYKNRNGMSQLISILFN